MKTMRKKWIPVLLCCTLLVLGLFTCSRSNGEETSSNNTNDEYLTYVFFGVDSRLDGSEWKNDDSSGTEGAPSSDVIMLVTIEKNGQDAKVISVFRDTMMNISGDGDDFEKCNAAYRYGGAYSAIQMLENNLDLRIEGYVTANFFVVADAIDLLGGVSVDVEDEETTPEAYEKYGLRTVVDTANRYIDEMNLLYHKDVPYIEHPGVQTLSGLQAVAYSRVRYTIGSDRKRTDRQRNIVFLMAQKLKETDPEKQRSVLKTIYNEVDTDLEDSELINIFDTIIECDLNNVGGFPFKMKSLNDKDKGVLLVPCDLSQNVTELHEYLYGTKNYLPNDTVMTYDSLIKEETGFTADDADETLNEY